MKDQLNLVQLKDKESETTHKEKLLWVEDNYDLFKTMIGEIDQERFEVDYASDSFNAFKLIQSHTYAMVICKLKMPVISGPNMISELAKKNYTVPFILYADNYSADEASEALRAGAFNLLEAPLEKATLERKIEEAITLSRKKRIDTIDDQDKAFVYNSLKRYYYDVDRLLSMINKHNVPMHIIQRELEKKEETGKCLLDEPQSLKFYSQAS